MTYVKLDVVPEHYEAPVWDNNRVLNNEALKWAGEAPPPPVGSKIKINFNNLGTATVTGYFVEHNWLGLLVTLHDAPEWHRKQRGNDPLAHIFGPEFKLA